MDTVTLVLLLLSSAAAGALIARLVRHSATHAAARQATVVETAPPAMNEVTDLLDAGAILIGPHDEVLHVNPAATRWQLTSATRIEHREVLDQVRSVRRLAAPQNIRVRVDRGPVRPPLMLQLQIINLIHDRVMVLARSRHRNGFDESTARDFVANISHELKTPIGAISLLAEAVQQGADDPEAVAHFAERMRVESVRLNEMVNQIINLSRLEESDGLSNAEMVSVGSVVDAAQNRCRTMAEERGVRFSRAGASTPLVRADPRQLIDAVTNLLHNAISYSDPEARVAITTRRTTIDDQPCVEILVADNGIGIKREDQERIFERFYRVDFGRSRTSGGTGLGLAIVKQIAQAHDGTVSLWSSFGQGSTFMIRLPEYTDQSPQQTVEGQTVEGQTGAETD